MAESEKIDLRSKDILAERLYKLRDLLPEAFREGKINFEALKQALGEEIDPGRERYGLTWAGKSEAIKNIQTPSVGTLVPVPEESVNFETTENLIIEGDNLEVLKLLQKSYHSKVKMIYIDPPYNTGNEFIYPDNFREGLEDYLRYSGQMNGDGIKLTTNAETDGRYHSKWLNMMYPRLFLARNLLREDGVILISIDDHEVHNLRLLMNEIFGEENFLAQVVWNLGTGTQAGHFTRSHEYFIVYARNKGILANFSAIEDGNIFHGALKKISKANPASEIKFPAGIEFEGKDAVFKGELGGSEKQIILSEKMVFEDGKLKYPVKLKAGWGMKNQILSWLDGKETFDSKGQKVVRFYFNKQGILWYEKERGTFNPKTIISDMGSTKQGSSELEQLFGVKVMDFPKPSNLLKYLVNVISGECDIILDFFAGSGTTAHAVLDLNFRDAGNRKFILVQLPEPTNRTEYPTIAEICKERVRKVIAKLEQENKEKLDIEGRNKQDRGFKVFKLTSSNFKIWDAAKASRDADELAKQLTLFADNLKPDRSQLDILYEILLKAGLPLTTEVSKMAVAGQEVFSVAGGQLLICLEQVINRETLRSMMRLQPRQVICLDAAFHGQDKLKTNTVLEMKSHDIQFRTV